MARTLLAQVLDAFLPAGEVVVGVDDTIERRWGSKIRVSGSNGTGSAFQLIPTALRFDRSCRRISGHGVSAGTVKAEGHWYEHAKLTY